MAFTDVELLKLKGSADAITKHGDRVGILPEGVYALLARLEAAENILNDALGDGTLHPIETLVVVWLKECGK